jgi:hypothetical protein
MQQLFDKMKEYLNMDTEISFEEFRDYFQSVVEELKAHFETMEAEEAFQALFILYNLESNCEYRAKRKLPETKKYKKMRETANIWIAAIRRRLNKLGYSELAISERMEELSEAV